MVEFLKRLFGKKQQPRTYQVPEGLADRVCYLGDLANSGSLVGSRALWKLIYERCPEAKQGKWQIRQTDADVFLEEVIA